MKHQSHPAVIARLKRAEGHLRAVIAMLAEEKPCLDIAQQLHAVEAAVANAKRELIHDHIEHCLEGGGEMSARDAIGELKQLTKYL
jgi:uncharacterized protein